MKMKNFELQRVENLGSTTDSIGVDHSNRGQLYIWLWPSLGGLGKGQELRGKACTRLPTGLLHQSLSVSGN